MAAVLAMGAGAACRPPRAILCLMLLRSLCCVPAGASLSLVYLPASNASATLGKAVK